MRGYADQLLNDPAAAARVEQAKTELLDRPDVRDYLSSLWFWLKKLILDGANDPDSDLRRSCAVVDDPGR